MKVETAEKILRDWIDSRGVMNEKPHVRWWRGERYCDLNGEFTAKQLAALSTLMWEKKNEG